MELIFDALPSAPTEQWQSVDSYEKLVAILNGVLIDGHLPLKEDEIKVNFNLFGEDEGGNGQ